MGDKTYTPFIEWLTCDCGKKHHGILRLFENPLMPLTEDNMPAQPWIWCCNFNFLDEGKTVLIRAALTAPPIGAITALRQIAKEYNVTTLRWERYHNGIYTYKDFKVS